MYVLVCEATGWTGSIRLLRNQFKCMGRSSRLAGLPACSLLPPTHTHKLAPLAWFPFFNLIEFEVLDFRVRIFDSAFEGFDVGVCGGDCDAFAVGNEIKFACHDVPSEFWVAVTKNFIKNQLSEFVPG